jgi:hypothetical protein
MKVRSKYFLALILTSCLTTKFNNKIERIDLYGIPLISKTKLPIGVNVIQDSTFYLSRIVNPELFISKLENALVGKTKFSKNDFDFSDIRMVYAIHDHTNSNSTIVVSRGGVEMYYNGYVYRVDTEIAQVIAMFLPEKEALRSEEDRRFYKKQKFTPLECCR